MCQIISFTAKGSTVVDNPEAKKYLKNYLKIKGSQNGKHDYTSMLVADSDNKKHTIFTGNTIDEVLYAFEQNLKAVVEGYNPEKKYNFMIFSRQEPEMEIGYPNILQPYTSCNFDDIIFSVHGTVYNAEKLAEKYNTKIKIDTDILQELSNLDEAEGSFSIIYLDKIDYMFKFIEHGLKVWVRNVIKDKFDNVIFENILGTSSFELFEKKSQKDSNQRTLMVAFSGGMDISLSTYKLLSTHYRRVILNYFDWGTRASSKELKAIEDFKRRIYPGAEVNIINAKKFFKHYFKITDAQLPKIANKNAIGDKSETESPIAYVPYRNSQFAIDLAALAESMNLKNVDILFGLNLSEGMVFMDNSEGWLEAISTVVKFGGKDFKITGGYRVISPYFGLTKTNMIKSFREEFGDEILNEILDISFSCYFPKNGEPCGKCGSCILRQEAIASSDV